MSLDISIIIITFNRKKKVERLINSINKSKFDEISYEIVVVDDCSTDGTAKYLMDTFSELGNMTVLSNSENVRVSQSRNRGIKASSGKYIYCLDDDVILKEDSIINLVKFMQSYNNENIILSPVMFEYDNPSKIWFAGLKLNLWTTVGKFLYTNISHKKLVDIGDCIHTDAIVTAFMMHREHVETIGFFDEELFKFQFEELDFFIRSRYQGFSLLVVTNSVLYHDHAKGSFLDHPWRLELTARNRIIISRLWAVNGLQEVVALLSSLFLLCEYFVLKLTIYRKKPLECFRSLFKGTLNGFQILFTLKPYRKRDGFNVDNLKS